MLEKDEIARLIPHGEAMCLLDRVCAYNDNYIHCETRSHLDLHNPLRERDRLGAAILVEYGAQAAAIHGALIAATAPEDARPAYIGAIRGMELEVERIDGLTGLLHVEAKCEIYKSDGAIYLLEIGHEDRRVMRAQLILIRPHY